MTRGFNSASQSATSEKSAVGREAPPPCPFVVAVPLMAPSDRPQRTRGSSSKVWNGGGELTCHSSVVAPSPQ